MNDSVKNILLVALILAPLVFGQYCYTPPAPRHGEWVDLEGYPVLTYTQVRKNAAIIFRCEEGYKLSSTNATQVPILCLGTGDWSVTTLPTCKRPVVFRRRCLAPEYPRHGHWIFEDGFSDLDSATIARNTRIIFRCEEGYKLSSTNDSQQTILCGRNGEWNVSIFPTCERPLVSAKRCLTPAFPQHGGWVSTDGIPGLGVESVLPNTSIIFRCEEGYKLSSTNDNEYSIGCLPTGEWSVSAFPKCEKLCKGFNNTDIITYKCKRDNALVPCHRATDDTVMTHKCASGYEPVLGMPSTSVCLDGSWDYLPKCVPVCGEKKNPPSPLIVKGREVERDYYPWVVAIYSNRDISQFKNICAGTLISTNIVLTAAHCVTSKEDGTVYPAKDYRIGAGKRYVNYQDERDSATAQYDEIESIAVPRDYKGKIQNYRGDIALLKTKGNFPRSEMIQPICFHNLPHIEPGTNGSVTGWSFTAEMGKQSDELKEVKLPFISNEDCFEQLDSDFAQRYFISDKLCTGFANESIHVCNGDGGSALTFKNPLYRNRYFIHGIFSTAGKLVCNRRQNGLFTLVESYLEWIHIQVRHWENKDQALRRDMFTYRR